MKFRQLTNRIALILTLIIAYVLVFGINRPEKALTPEEQVRQYNIVRERYSGKDARIITPSQVAIVTYYAPQSNKEHQIHFEDELYKNVSHYSMTNIADYCSYNGFAFFFRNNHMVDTETKAAYWGKMDVVEYYLKKGFEWVIWTDIDVLFLKERSLVDHWLSFASPNQHMAFVTECNDHEGELGTVRSGFFAVRNTKEGLSFLKAWKDTFAGFKGHFNPEQEALEGMVLKQPWKSWAMIAPHNKIHTYPYCLNYDTDPISVHFSGGTKWNMREHADKLYEGKEKVKDFQINFPALDFE
ncbi:hypothetical protein HDV04_002731 [Boothiomyces sp. JEL0838]|nr:hypothetical protein HDV04_002731 [Boothiomyces sp. JEL0838]